MEQSLNCLNGGIHRQWYMELNHLNDTIGIYQHNQEAGLDHLNKDGFIVQLRFLVEWIKWFKLT